jgi:uracil-DNA glycosylase
VTAETRAQALEGIAGEVRACTRCRLHQGRTRAVPGEGHPDTEVVFVGEGPGYNEDQQGRPFVGAAGGLLTELLRSVGWERSEVFITNVVKCRPPGNRDPEPDEIAACRPYLERQLQVLDPALVVTLGRFSMNTFMPGARIGSAHGTVRPVEPATGAADALAYAMYHPAAAFRQNALKETLRADMAGIPDVLIRARQIREEHARTAAGSVRSTEDIRTGASVEVVAVPIAGERVAVPIEAARPTPARDGATGEAGRFDVGIAIASAAPIAAPESSGAPGGFSFDALELAPDELPPPPDDPRDQLSLF